MKAEYKIHCSYHKCLTAFYRRVVSKTFRILLKNNNTSYLHTKSLKDKFYENIDNYEIISINNQNLDFKRFNKKYKITRFVRDPRDLIVSGYFYHKKGTEPWTRIKNPSLEDWKVVNGNIPKSILNYKGSYCDFLNKVPIEEGLLAEMEFRKFHFESMQSWEKNENIRVFKYEDILGNESSVFKSIFKFYGYNDIISKIAGYYAKKYSSPSFLKKDKHVRNTEATQWQSIFSNKILERFYEQYSDLLIESNYG